MAYCSSMLEHTSPSALPKWLSSLPWSELLVLTCFFIRRLASLRWGDDQKCQKMPQMNIQPIEVGMGSIEVLGIQAMSSGGPCKSSSTCEDLRHGSGGALDLR